MRFAMCGAIVVLLMLNNYSFAANKCENLFKNISEAKTLKLSKLTPEEQVIKKLSKKYAISDVNFLYENISIIKRASEGKSPHMRMIRSLEKNVNGDFLLMVQKSHIIIEYMVESGFLRDVAQSGSNPKDAIFSSYFKALYFNSLNAMKDKSEGRSEKVSHRWEKSFIKEWAALRGHLYDVVTKKYGTVIYKGNILNFLFDNLKELQVKLEMPDIEHQIRLAVIKDLAQVDKLLGLHASAIKSIGASSYRINHVRKVDETLEAIYDLAIRTDREYTESLTSFERKMLASSLFGLMNLFHRKSPSSQSIEIIERVRAFASQLEKQRSYTAQQQESFKVDKNQLFQLNVEAFVEQVGALKLSKNQISELAVEYVKKKGSLSEEEYFLLNELNLNYKSIDELEVFYSPIAHL